MYMRYYGFIMVYQCLSATLDIMQRKRLYRISWEIFPAIYCGFLAGSTCHFCSLCSSTRFIVLECFTIQLNRKQSFFPKKRNPCPNEWRRNTWWCERNKQPTTQALLSRVLHAWHRCLLHGSLEVHRCLRSGRLGRLGYGCIWVAKIVSHYNLSSCLAPDGSENLFSSPENLNLTWHRGKMVEKHTWHDANSMV